MKQGYFLGIPYDWRLPTGSLLKERFWNKRDHRLFTPKVFGWGYSLNFYELLHNRKKLLVGLVTCAVLALVSAGLYIKHLDEAHSSFEKYYAFRGCSQLLERKRDYGVCKTSTGETIKIVQYRKKWYLDGDLPCGFLCF